MNLSKSLKYFKVFPLGSQADLELERGGGLTPVASRFPKYANPATSTLYSRDLGTNVNRAGTKRLLNEFYRGERESGRAPFCGDLCRGERGGRLDALGFPGCTQGLLDLQRENSSGSDPRREREERKQGPERKQRKQERTQAPSWKRE